MAKDATNERSVALSGQSITVRRLNREARRCAVCIFLFLGVLAAIVVSHNRALGFGLTDSKAVLLANGFLRIRFATDIAGDRHVMTDTRWWENFGWSPSDAWMPRFLQGSAKRSVSSESGRMFTVSWNDKAINIPLHSLAILLGPTALVLTALYLTHQIPAHCCQSCGYNLTGNTSGRCPECGQQVAVRIPFSPTSSPR